MWVLTYLLVEVYRLVKEARQSIFRPTLLDTDDEDLLSMIRRCWSEEPCDRPDFNVVKGMIKRINKCVDRLWSIQQQHKPKLDYCDRPVLCSLRGHIVTARCERSVKLTPCLRILARLCLGIRSTCISSLAKKLWPLRAPNYSHL